MPAKNKRANGEGSVYQRGSDGLWVGAYVIGFDADGKSKRKPIYGKTKGEVVKKLREAQTQIDKGLFVEPDKMTVGQWVDTWFNEYIKPHKRPATVETYNEIIQHHIIPGIGELLLQKLRAEHVQSFYNRMAASESKLGKKYSSASVRKMHVILHSALEQAVKNKLILQNTTKTATLPKLEQEEIEYLTIQEQRRLLEVLPSTTTGRAIAFFLATGLRASELCGLRWKDIGKDFFTVSQTIMRKHTFEKGAETKTAFFTTKTKTKAGNREIPIAAKAREILSSQKKAQSAQHLKAGAAWVDTDIVFATDTGSPTEARNLARFLHNILEKNGLKKRGLHALRHTFATRAIESGMDVRTLSEILGHSDVKTTLNLYCHSSMETKRNSLAIMESMI